MTHFWLVIAFVFLSFGILAIIPSFTKSVNWRNWKIFASSAESVKLSRYEGEVVELVARKKELEFAIKNQENERAAIKLEYEQKLREEKQKFELEQRQLKSDIKIEKDAQTAAFGLKEKELLALKQLEIQKLKQEHEVLVQKIKMETEQEFNSKLFAERQKLLSDQEAWTRDAYDKQAASMRKLHEEGNHSTKFVQGMAKEMLQLAPGIRHLDIGVGQPQKRVYEVRQEDMNTAPVAEE